MDKSNASLPVVATSSGWTPIEFFDFGADYARQQPILICITDAGGHAWCEVGRALRGSIVSEWQDFRDGNRLINKLSSGVQLAFKLIEGPDLRALQRDHQRGAQFITHMQSVQPKKRMDGTSAGSVGSKALAA
jgi:hypothetical protein